MRRLILELRVDTDVPAIEEVSDELVHIRVGYNCNFEGLKRMLGDLVSEPEIMRIRELWSEDLGERIFHRVGDSLLICSE